MSMMAQLSVNAHAPCRHTKVLNETWKPVLMCMDFHDMPVQETVTPELQTEH